MEYLTAAELRAEFGDDVSELTDAQLLRRLDRLAAALETNLGHTCGRALVVTSTAAHTVQVTASKLIFAGASSAEFAFADYPTLAALETAVNAANAGYALALLSYVHASTPTTLLRPVGPVLCGDTYDKRQILDISAQYVLLTAKRESHLFLPLPLRNVISVVEDGVTLDTTAYWAVPGDCWLIRKLCSCIGCGCSHPKGRWKATYPGNIAVTYVPQWWGGAPGTLRQLLVEAFASASGLTPLEAEDFGGKYSYRRKTATVATWQEILGSASARPYAVRFHP